MTCSGTRPGSLCPPTGDTSLSLVNTMSTGFLLVDRSLDEVQEELYSLVVAEVDRDKGALGRLWVTEAEVNTPSSSHTDSH